MAWIRLVAIAVTVLNTYLTARGWNPMPFSEDEIYQGVSGVALVFTVWWNWWKNNSITQEAKEADKYLQKLKTLKKD